jgi:2,3-bisphosphoglycerate-dependent phosphoglycerate mutase
VRTELLLVRHGQTDWNLEGRYQGKSDVALNEAGRRQAERIAEDLAARRIDAIYSSALSRSLETARAIAARHGLEAIPDPRLNEIDQGEWEGVVVTEIAERHPELFAQWGRDPRGVRPPGGESIREVHDRVIGAVEQIARRHPGGTVCLVSHKTAIVVIRSHYRGLDLPEQMGSMPGNASWESIEVEPRPLDEPAPESPCCSAAWTAEGSATTKTRRHKG